jgi:anaerobic dimethyl sulfoxide reductase subunit B (iron-sulfur subunit)
MIQLGFHINQQRCIGCHTCAVACKDWYDIEAGPENWMRIREIEEGKFPNLSLAFLPVPCYHCEDPACLKICPVQAIIKREKDGIVMVDSDKCIGGEECGNLCLKACPWKCPQFGRQKNAKMQKCALCYARIDKDLPPICVEACPMFAIEVGPIKELRRKYGDEREAIGFKYSKKLRPSVIYKSK